MCGIAAIISGDRAEVLQNIIPMTDLIRHRGPNDEGFIFLQRDGTYNQFGGRDTPEEVYKASFQYTPQKVFLGEIPHNAYVAFGHRRLSIVDLSPAGHQPLSYANGRYWITYNGEIYNYLELRKELEKVGHRFVSHTDTEVILAAYAEWGEDCQQRFNGMWAFVIYDAQTKTIFVSRDRFGIKPLYYWQLSDRSLAIASEIKQFTAFSDWSAKTNIQRCYDFLVWGLSNHTKETLFKDVYQLR